MLCVYIILRDRSTLTLDFLRNLRYPHHMTLLFQFGSHPELSLAELIARVPVCAGGRMIAGRFYRIDCAEPPAWLMDNLGGVVKILEIIAEGGQPDPEALARHILDRSVAKNKATFGTSIINAPEFAGLNLAIKRSLQEISDRPVRAATSRDKELSSATVQLEKLLAPDGVELVVIKDSSHIVIAQTVAAQSFDEWSYRDYKRPGRDAKRGMLPPKLAKMMINLALGDADPTHATVYDPFCGSGTVLTEGALLGFGRALGSDISPAAVSDSKDAVTWAVKQFGLAAQIEIFKHDATAPAGHMKPRSVDCIVAETFLGRPLSHGEKMSDEEKAELVSLYSRALRALAPVLKPDGRVVLALPFQTKPQEFLPLNKILNGTPFSLSSEPLLYARDDQRTGRQIIRLKKA